MFNINNFKKSVKDWIRTHPDGEETDLIDFCEEQIPSTQFAANKWLIDQTVGWFKHVQAQREMARRYASGANEEDAI